MYSCLSFTVTSYDDSFLVQEPVYEHEQNRKENFIISLSGFAQGMDSWKWITSDWN